jgi:hypothetical protein
MKSTNLDISTHVLDHILDGSYTVHCNFASENKEQSFPIIYQYDINNLRCCVYCLLRDVDM